MAGQCQRRALEGKGERGRNLHRLLAAPHALHIAIGLLIDLQAALHMCVTQEEEEEEKKEKEEEEEEEKAKEDLGWPLVDGGLEGIDLLLQLLQTQVLPDLHLPAKVTL